MAKSKKNKPESNAPEDEGKFDEVGVLQPRVVTDRLTQTPGYNRPVQEEADILQSSVSSSPIDEMDAKTALANQTLADRELAEATAAVQQHETIRGEQPQNEYVPAAELSEEQKAAGVGGLSGRYGADNPSQPSVLAAAGDPYMALRSRMPAPEHVATRKGGISESSKAALNDWNESHRTSKERAKKAYLTYVTNYGIHGAGGGLDKGLVHLFAEHEAIGCMDASCTAERRRLKEAGREFNLNAFKRAHPTETSERMSAILSMAEDLHARQKEVAPLVPHIMDPHVDVSEDEWKNNPRFQYYDNLYHIGSALTPGLSMKDAANGVRKALYLLTPQGRQTAMANAQKNAKNLSAGVIKDKKGNIDVKAHEAFEAAGGAYKTQRLQTGLALADSNMASWATGPAAGNDVQTMARRISGVIRRARGGIGKRNSIDRGVVNTYVASARQMVESGSTDLTDLQRKLVGNIVGAEEAKSTLRQASDITVISPETNINAVLEHINRLGAVTGGGKETAARNSSGFDPVQGARRTDVDLRKASVQAAKRIPSVVMAMADQINSVPTLSKITGKPAEQLQSIADSAAADYDPQTHGYYEPDTTELSGEDYLNHVIHHGIPGADRGLDTGLLGLYNKHLQGGCKNKTCAKKRDALAKSGKSFDFDAYAAQHKSEVQSYTKRATEEVTKRGKISHIGRALSSATRGLAIDPQELIGAMTTTAPSLTNPTAEDVVTTERPAPRARANADRIGQRWVRKQQASIQEETGVPAIPEPGPGIPTTETRTENATRVADETRQQRRDVRAARKGRKNGVGNTRQFGE